MWQCLIIWERYNNKRTNLHIFKINNMNFGMQFGSSSKTATTFNPGGYDLERIEDGIMH